MNVCHIQFAYYPGQGNIALYEYTQVLSKLGVKTHVIVVGRKDEEKEDEVTNVAVHRISFSKYNMRNLGSLLFFLKAAKTIKKIEKENGDFDIVHVFMGIGSFLVPVLGSLFRPGHRKNKYILDIRSGGIKGPFSSYMARIIINIESKFFDTITVLDEGLARTLFGEKDIHTTYLGVNTDLFSPGRDEHMRKKLGIKPHHITFIYTGSIHPARNLKVLICAFSKVNKTYENTKLLIVGEGEDFKSLKKAASAHNLQDHIIFTGYVDYNEVPHMINASDIAISYVPITPAYDFQPLLKTVEYIACGIPTIATDTEGNRRFIKDGYNGILIKDDCDSLYNAMVMLIEDKRVRETLRKNSPGSVVGYDWKTIVETNIIPLYNELLKNE